MKRKLTLYEIDTVLKGVSDLHKSIFPTIKKKFLEHLRTQWKPKLEKIEIYESQIPTLIKHILNDYQKSLIQPGECVGILCAQSIGERQTQLTLNSFHSAGLLTQTVVTGVPRFLELLNATKDPKLTSCSFLLHPEVRIHIQTPQDVRQFLENGIVCQTFGQLMERYQLFYETEEELWYSPFEQIYQSDFRVYEVGIKFFLHRKNLWEYRISLFHIKKCIEQHFNDCVVVFSPQHIGQVDVFVDTSDLRFNTLENKNNKNGVSFPNVPDESKYLEMYLEDVVIPRLSDIQICGCKNIQKMYIQKEQDGLLRVNTVGSNMMELMGHPDVDMPSVYCNQMWEILQCMGIEATREFLMREFNAVVSNDGTFLHPAHLQLLVDFMTHHGTILSISRYGMKRETNGPLSKASFEEVMDHFLHASFMAENEPVESISASIICGKRSKMGSGLCSLIVDTENLPS